MNYGFGGLAMIDDNNKAICAAPWMHYYLQPNGNMHPCCTSQGINYGNTNDMSLHEAWNSATAQKFRNDILSGIKQDACSHCYAQEKHSGSSLRTSLNERYSNAITGNITPNMNIKYLDVRSSNTCNMACVMCYHGLSSSWYEDLRYINPNLHFNSEKFIKINKDTETQVLETISPDLDTVYFAGGEPLITPYHYTVLDYLIENDYAKNIRLDYNTNLSTLKYKNRNLFDLWKHFKHVEIRASVDAFGEYAEYQRYGTVWDTIISNWKKVLEHPEIIIRPQITITSLSISKLPEFLDVLTEELDCKLDYDNQIDGITFNIANRPTHLDIRNIPEDVKKVYIDKLNMYCEKNNCLTTPLVETCISYMEENKSDPAEILKLLKYLDILDSSRNKCWSDLWPEFLDYYNNGDL